MGPRAATLGSRAAGDRDLPELALEFELEGSRASHDYEVALGQPGGSPVLSREGPGGQGQVKEEDVTGATLNVLPGPRHGLCLRANPRDAERSDRLRLTLLANGPSSR
jgi:hypothetical protein